MSVKVIKKSNCFKRLLCKHLPIKAIRLSSYHSLSNKLGFCRVVNVCSECGRITTEVLVARHSNKKYDWSDCCIYTFCKNGDVCVFTADDAIKRKVGL